MTIRNLEYLFKPKSVAIVGASERAGSIGQRVTRNVLEAGFVGPVMLVNPAHRELFDRQVYADIASLPATPQLAIVTTPAAAAVQVLGQLAARGTRAAVVIAAGFSGTGDAPGARRRQALLETPPSLPEDFTPDVVQACGILAAARGEGREWLTELEAKQVLTCFGIATVATELAATAEEAAQCAARIGGRVALKIVSRDITHKSDVGGVLLDLDPVEVAVVAATMLARVRQARPAARIDGFAVQAMIRRPAALELIAGVMDDREFGPVILFGAGGTAVEVVNDKALTLPPLNLKLAYEVIARTRVARLLAGYRNVAAADVDGIALTLVRLSPLVVDLPQVAELDINPLLADADGVLALDARIRLHRGEMPAASRLAIRPYPKDLEELITGDDGETLLLRPIRPEDETALQATFARLSPEEVRFRFFVPMKLMDHVTAARFSQIDYDRQMALVLTVPGIAGETAICGVVRRIEDPDRDSAEFAIVIEHRMSGRGLGTPLMQRIIDYGRRRGLREIYGEVLADNYRMLTLCRECGSSETRELLEPGVVRVAMVLRG